VDSDEIRYSPWPEIKLRNAIFAVDQAGFTAIDHTLLNFIPIDNNFKSSYDFELYFKYFEFGTKPGHFIQIKTWKNFGKKISLAELGGYVVQFEERKIFPYHFLLKHYQFRSQKHGEKKAAERLTRFHPKEKSMGWHTHYDHITRNYNFLKKPTELTLFSKNFYRYFLIERLSGIGVFVDDKD